MIESSPDSPMNEIREHEWRVSRSGFSIRTGWSDEKKMIAAYPGKASPLDTKQYAEWLDNANHICELHNSALTAQTRHAESGHHPDCNYWKWDRRYSWDKTDCNCDVVGAANSRHEHE